MQYKSPKHILPIIVLSQFAGTSLWFVGNAILPDIQRELHIGNNALGNITSSVQFGFITGTLVFALLVIADRFSAIKVFFASTTLAALFNLLIAFLAKDFISIIVLRFLTGFFLAGIYPVGMKIASDWYEKGLGKALGFLVGALVLGTAFPHLLKNASFSFSWQKVILFTSAFAFTGGLLMLLFVQRGPYAKKGNAFHPKALMQIFRSKDFRAASFGYFGHMWELYTFWAFVPAILTLFEKDHAISMNIPLLSFIIIGIGGLSCVAGGYISQKKGSAPVAFYSMLLSASCCVLYWIFLKSNAPVFIAFMLLWGISVISDSPQFSSLVAQTAPPEYKGTALTFVTCIGFSITIVSIQLLNYLFNISEHSSYIFILLAPGPLLGMWFFRSLMNKPVAANN